jgi:hypothetical protein
MLRDTPQGLASVHHELEEIGLLLIYLESKLFHEPKFPITRAKKGGVISDSPFITSLGAKPRIDISSSNCRPASLHQPQVYHSF